MGAQLRKLAGNQEAGRDEPQPDAQVEPDAAEPELVAQLGAADSGAAAQRERGHAAEEQGKRQPPAGHEVIFLRFREPRRDEADGHDDDEVQRDDDVVDRR